MSSHFDVYSTKSLLHNHSQSQTTQVLELEIENNFRMDLDVASNYWTERDNLDDRSFSHLKEIRLLFESFIEISSPRRTLPHPNLNGNTLASIVTGCCTQEWESEEYRLCSLTLQNSN